MAKNNKLVYSFGAVRTHGDGKMKNLLGGKGANLAEMCRIGLPVPPGFTITTDVCRAYYDNGRKMPVDLDKQVDTAIKLMEKQLGKKFGDEKNPLLVAVRSGARESMPGMMDTILNLGLNDKVVEALAEKTQNPRFAWDCYRRFVQMYGDVVLGVQTQPGEDHEPFEYVMEEYKKYTYGDADYEDNQLTADDLKQLVKHFKKLVKDRTGNNFPADARSQLKGAVKAVFNSWMNDRAIVYRRKYNIPAEWGTAVNVQAMVFGNTGNESGSGVAFTRDPATGEKVFYGEFLINAQGEDVVAGVRTPQPVSELKKLMPKPYRELDNIRKQLEAHFRDMQDFEFTIEDGVVYMLQTRNGKRTGVAAVRIACEMVKERLMDIKTAITKVPAEQLDQVLAPIFDTKAVKNAKVLCKGLPAGPGAATGKVYLSAERAEAAANKNEKVLLVRVETSPEDLRGMIAADGILTAKGGVSSHAALVARQMGKVCVCGAADVHVDYGTRKVTINGVKFKEGEWMSIDGTSGEVFEGKIPTAPSEVVQALVENKASAKKGRTFKNFVQLMKWCNSARKLGVRTNADTPEQAAIAVAFGAEGIGLTRTEHMFFEGDRIDAVREMILATDTAAREVALAKLLPYQKSDFLGIFKALKGSPATIRLLDPPLHEFLPHTKEQQVDLADKIGVSVTSIMQRVNDLHEFNPMLGHRGCRLGVVFPEITAMQARAIFEAAAECVKKKIKVKPEIMVPLVGYPKELKIQAAVIHAQAKAVMKEKKVKFSYQVGTMIEVPRAALVADKIAAHADFFSFGTNDLTQTGLGMSRDDSGAFLPYYAEEEIIPRNPFATLDTEGVGQLVEMGVAKGRSVKEALKCGICGEHGGDPSSIDFCHKVGLNYVSCSPYRVPTAILAAAQSAVVSAPVATAKKKVTKKKVAVKKSTAKKVAKKTPAKKVAKKVTKKVASKK